LKQLAEGGAESGQITANRDVTGTATGMLDNRARISSGTDIRLSAVTLSNGTTGRVEAKNAATLSAPALLALAVSLPPTERYRHDPGP